MGKTVTRHMEMAQHNESLSIASCPLLPPPCSTLCTRNSTAHPWVHDHSILDVLLAILTLVFVVLVVLVVLLFLNLIIIIISRAWLQSRPCFRLSLHAMRSLVVMQLGEAIQLGSAGHNMHRFWARR